MQIDEAIVDIIHDNPQSSIIIQLGRDKGVIRIDVDERYAFEIEMGSDLGDVGISSSERMDMKKRRDLKHHIMGTDIPAQSVHTISRIGEED